MIGSHHGTRPAMRRGAGRAITSLMLLALLALAVVVGPLLLASDPLAQALGFRLKPPGWAGPDGVIHYLGTDQLGRDVLARVLAGARLSVIIAGAAILASLLIGVPLGMLSGFYGGALDRILMRVTDAQLAFPVVLFAIVLATAIGPSITTLVLVLALTAWTRHARVVYSIVRGLNSREFMLGARALGASDPRLMLRHVLPNILSPIIVVSAFLVSRMVLLEAALSFLGIGVPPPSPSLGNILSDGQEWIFVAPWLSIYPGIALAFIALVANTAGDYLRSRVSG